MIEIKLILADGTEKVIRREGISKEQAEEEIKESIKKRIFIGDLSDKHHTWLVNTKFIVKVEVNDC